VVAAICSHASANLRIRTSHAPEDACHIPGENACKILKIIGLSHRQTPQSGSEAVILY
jgi:hypothetical protein